MAWDDVVVDGSTVDYAADHNEEITQIKARLTGSLGAATPNNFIIVNAAGTGATPTNIPSEYLGVSQLGTPTLKTLQDWEDGTQSGGRVYGGVISDATGGLISVSAMKGMIKIADFTQGVQVPTRTKFFDYAGDTSWGGSGVGTTLTDNSINYIYIDYNSGTPKLLCTTDRSGIRKTDQFNIGRVFKNGTDIEVLTSGINLYNRTRLVHERWIDTFGGISRASGIIPSVSTTIGASPAWSLGVMYAGSNRIDIPAVNCAAGGGGTFSSYYTSDSGSTWTEVTGQVRIDWTKYNDITTGLASIGVSKYGVHWMYVCPEGEMYFLYGKGSYSLAEAQAAVVASPIPNYLSQWCLLAAKVIMSQAGALVSVTPAWSTTFPIQIAGNHSDLGGLDYASAGHTGFMQAGATPVYHSTSHATGGADVITPSSIGAMAVGATPVYHSSTHQYNGADTLGKMYRTIFLSLAGGWTGTTNADGGFTTTETNAGATATSFNIKGTFFDATSTGDDKTHEFTAPMPDNWDGSTITAIPYCVPKSVATAGDSLIFGLRGAVYYGTATTGDLITGLTFGTAATTQFTLATTCAGRLHKGTATSAITLSGATPVGGALVQWKTHRMGADTYPGGATLLGWKIIYGTNKYSDEA